MRGVSTTLMLALVLMMGATFGLHAESAADAEVTPRDLGFDKDTAAGGSAAKAEVMEGAFHYVAIWLSLVSTWSYEHPRTASLLLVNAPWIVIGAVAVKHMAKAALIAYVIIAERRARREEPGA